MSKGGDVTLTTNISSIDGADREQVHIYVGNKCLMTFWPDGSIFVRDEHVDINKRVSDLFIKWMRSIKVTYDTKPGANPPTVTPSEHFKLISGLGYSEDGEPSQDLAGSVILADGSGNKLTIGPDNFDTLSPLLVYTEFLSWLITATSGMLK